MQWSSLTEPSASLIWAVVALCAVLCGVMVLAVLLLSFRQQAAARRAAATARLWAPYLQRSHFADLPALALPQHPDCRAQAAGMILDAALRLDAGSRAPLVKLALRAGLDAYVLEVLARARRQSPVALETCLTLAGLFGLKPALPHLAPLMDHRTAAVSFAAALALLRLEPRALPQVWSHAPLFMFSRAALLTLLKAVPGGEVDQLVLHRIEHSSAKEAAQLLSAWAQLPGRAAFRYAAQLLANPDNEGWLLCAALRMQDDVSQVPRLLPYLDHPRWAVRLQALQAVARLGFAADVARIRPLREHANWWVRIRAREALASFDARGVL